MRRPSIKRQVGGGVERVRGALAPRYVAALLEEGCPPRKCSLSQMFGEMRRVQNCTVPRRFIGI
jgi:hypothetical protein